ncbi:MAG TPA: NADH-quinone oxidoreductase subunit C [Rhodothermia bacterium]
MVHRTLDFLFSPVDPPKPSAERKNPLAKDSTFDSDAVTALQDEFGEHIADVTLYANEHTVYVDRESIVDLCTFLKDRFGYVYLSDLGGIDRFTEEQRFEVLYSLIAMERGKRIRLKVRLDEEDLVVPSVHDVYPAAAWNERECWDMFGIRFDGHPDLRRMFMPEDFEHFPLRKEFPSLGIPGSLPLPSQTDDGEIVKDPFPAAHGSKPLRRTPFPE